MGILSKLKEEEPKEHGWQYKDFEGAVISPSGLRNLFDNPRTWYRNVVLRERTFFGNANTFFGTLVHKFAEDYYRGTLTKTDSFLSQVEIENICRKEGRNLDEIDYSNFKLCCRTLESEYLEIYPKPVEIEGYLEYKPFDDILVAGSFDALEINKDGTYTVIDFKTASGASKDMSKYFLQLNMYSLLLELVRGIRVTNIRVVEIVKTKTPKINIIECKPDYDFAKSVLERAVRIIQVLRTNDELVDLFMTENFFSFTSEESMTKNASTVITNTESMKRKVLSKIFD